MRTAQYLTPGDASSDPDKVPRLPHLSDAEAHKLGLACKAAIHVVTRDGDVLRAGRASLFMLTHTRWPRLGAVAGRRPLIWCVELGYWILARNRMLFSRVFFRE